MAIALTNIAITVILIKVWNEQCLSVSWTFGFKHSFADLPGHIIRDYEVSFGGELLNAKGHALGSSFPTDVL